MGGKQSRSQEVFKSSNPNGKQVELACEICASWGFGGKVDVVKSTIVKLLTDQGYEVIIDFIPVENDRGAYYLYKVNGENKQLIFSNNKGKHGTSDNVIFDSKISSKISPSIVEALLR